MKHHHSSQQITAEFLLELLGRLASHVDCNVAQRYAAWLIDLLQTINERPALNCDSPAVIRHARIGFDDLRHDFKLKMNDVARRPAAANWQISPRCCTRHALGIDTNLCMIGPARNP